MKVIYHDGTFYCDADKGATALKGHKWRWNTDIEQWETTMCERVKPFLPFATSAAKVKVERWEKSLRESIADSFAASTAIQYPCPEGESYLDYQQAGIDFAVNHDNHILIADPMGLGKTIQGIGYTNIRRMSPILIIVPATLKDNWKREYEKWDVHKRTVGICDSKTRSRTIKNPDGTKTIERWREDIFPDTEVVIINYEQLAKFDLYIKAKHWLCVIIDEADRLRNGTSKANKCVFGGNYTKKSSDGKKVKEKYKAIRTDKFLFLTGTPLVKGPINLWPIIQVCDPYGLGKNYMSFVRRYCDAQHTGFGLDVSGASNLEELQFKMRQKFMVRRNKMEVLSELPPKRREIVILPKEGLTKQVERELSAARKGMWEFEKMMGLTPTDDPSELSEFDLIKTILAAHMRYAGMSDGERLDHLKNQSLEIAFEEFAEARMELSLAKIPMIKERIARAMDEEDKIVFFGVHTDFIDALAKEYDNCAVITGKVPVKKRQAQVDMFQNDPDCKYFFGNIQAAGVGITLTAASFGMMGEFSWNETENEQAEDRIWRIGQTMPCLWNRLVVDGSLDARFVEINWDKAEVAARSLDMDRLTPEANFVDSGLSFV